MPVVRTDGRAGGRSVYGHVITNFSRMDSLPHFFTHGAPLRALANESSAIKPEEINFNQSIIFLCPLLSGSELKYLSSMAKTELTYPPFLVKLLSGVNVRANIFRMEKQNITISDECSDFRAQFYSPRSEFIYDTRGLARAKINGKFIFLSLV